MRDDLMTLKEVCRKAGVTRKMVQTYEHYGFVKPTSKNKYGYLLYDNDALKQIKQTRLYQKFGFTLPEISIFKTMDVEEQKLMLKGKINKMYERQSELVELIEKAEELLQEM